MQHFRVFVEGISSRSINASAPNPNGARSPANYPPPDTAVSGENRGAECYAPPLMNLLRLSTSPLPVSASWYAIPLRLIVGFGFIQHGYAKLVRGPEDFIGVLHAMGLPLSFLLGWLTIIVELVGGLMILVGALISPTPWKPFCSGLQVVRFGSFADMTARARHVHFTPNNGRWAAHPSQHFGCAFMSALVDAGEETAACSANVATMMGGWSTKSVTQGYLC
jgi:DoxX-like protein